VRNFLEELGRRRVFRTAAVYLVVAWGAVEVGATVLPLAGAPEWAPRLVLAVVAAGFPVALVLAWLYDLRPSAGGPAERGDPRVGLGQALMIATATVAGLAIPVFIFLDRDPASSGAVEAATPRRPAPERTVAVLPFRGAGPDAEDAYFAAGITDELVGALASFEDLRVLNREAAGRLLAEGALPQEVGRRLGAGFLLEGSVRRAGTTVRVSASLTRTETGEVAWSEEYDRDLTVANLFEVQEQVARAVAAELDARLAPARSGRLGRPPTGDLVAFDHYLKGDYELFRRTPASVLRAIAEFRTAADLDPGFTAARARESYAYGIFLDWDWTYPGADAPELLTRATGLAAEALAQDSASAEAWLALGYATLLQDRTDPARALPAFERALALDPADAETFHQYGQTLMSLGRYSEAAVAYHGALALDPTRAMTLVPLAAMSHRSRNPAEARRWIDSAVAVGPGVPYAWSYRANLRNGAGDHAGAIDDASRALRVDPSYAIPARSALAVAHHHLGHDEEAAAELERAFAALPDPSRPGLTDALYLGGAFASVGREREALDLLERVRPAAWLWFYLQHPDFDHVRDHPRFVSIERASDPRPARP